MSEREATPRGLRPSFVVQEPWLRQAYETIDRAVCELVTHGFTGTLNFPFGTLRIPGGAEEVSMAESTLVVVPHPDGGHEIIGRCAAGARPIESVWIGGPAGGSPAGLPGEAGLAVVAASPEDAASLAGWEPLPNG